MTDYEIVLICTDRGRHDAETVHTTEVTGDPADMTAEMLVPTLPGSRLELPCSCGRSPHIRALNLARMYELFLAQIRAGQRRVVCDVSKLGI